MLLHIRYSSKKSVLLIDNHLFQLVSHKSCKTSNGKTFPIKQLSAEETDVTVSGLVPYAEYSFSVSAWNRKIEGPPVNVTQDTFASGRYS
jgi:hypothetical protein